nr:immunoglobulin heavy chain junction region [Macaca mulatta]
CVREGEFDSLDVW